MFYYLYQGESLQPVGRLGKKTERGVVGVKFPLMYTELFVNTDLDCNLDLYLNYNQEINWHFLTKIIDLRLSHLI